MLSINRMEMIVLCGTQARNDATVLFEGRPTLLLKILGQLRIHPKPDSFQAFWGEIPFLNNTLFGGMLSNDESQHQKIKLEIVFFTWLVMEPMCQHPHLKVENLYELESGTYNSII